MVVRALEPPGLDTTILELAGYPQEVDPDPARPCAAPQAVASKRAYVIGHPLGLAQPQFSLQDNILLDYDQRVLHYRSPTEPAARAVRSSTTSGS